MKEIEKLFEEKLKHHQVTPPAGSWEKLHSQLHTPAKRSLAFYRKIAASVLLLLAAAVVVYLYLNKAVSPVTPDIAVKQETQQIIPKADQPLAEEKEILTKLPMAQQDQQSAKQQAVLQKKSAGKPAGKTDADDSYLVQKPWTKVSKVASQSFQELALKNDAASQAITDISPADALTSYQPVTIVYRDAKPEKTFGLFSYLKSANISLSELRQTKDELIDKAFSSKSQEAGR